jgi:putative addiction module killer protein
VKPKELAIYQTDTAKEPFSDWLSELDSKVRGRIRSRLDRLEQEGHYGDYKSVGDSVYELRFFFGSGYRVYFAEDGHTIVLLLSGGDKDSQDKDILQAKAYWKHHLKVKEERAKEQEDKQ